MQDAGRIPKESAVSILHLASWIMHHEIMVEKTKKRVLFICTHNSARSQMAEGLLRTMYGDEYDVYSAGTQPSNVNPHAAGVMSEIGIDISSHRSKTVDELHDMEFDYVVTVCDHAKETCPFFSGGKKYLHQSFEDPSRFRGTEEEILNGFRQVREDIKSWIQETFSRRN